jgi:hypothetical protein
MGIKMSFFSALSERIMNVTIGLQKTGASSNNTLKIWNSYPPQLNLVLMADVIDVACPKF